LSAEIIQRSLEQIQKTFDILRTRNRSLAKLVFLFRYFNHPMWILKVADLKAQGKPPKRQYPIEEIMEKLSCSERTAYDYSITLEALGYCLNLSKDDLFLLAYAHRDQL
jgi:hypothetical protein